MINFPQILQAQVVGVEWAELTETIHDERGNVSPPHPTHGGYRAWLRLNMHGLILRAEVSIEDLNALIEFLENQRENTSDDSSYVEAVALLDQVAGFLIGKRADASLHKITWPFDQAMSKARELLAKHGAEPSKDD